MQNAIQPITEDFKGNPVRIIPDSEAHSEWILADAAKSLGYKSASDAARVLKPHQKGLRLVQTLGGPQQMLVCTEGGLNRLIMRSDHPEAEEFQDWVTDEVLPKLRRDGFYVMPKPLTPVVAEKPTMPTGVALDDALLLFSHAIIETRRELREFKEEVREKLDKATSLGTALETWVTGTVKQQPRKRTNEEKRREAWNILLKNPERTNQWIANMSHTTATFVAPLRVKAESLGLIPPQEVRQDVNYRPMNIINCGRKSSANGTV